MTKRGQSARLQEKENWIILRSMNFFKQLFRNSKATAQCPRCLGKGHVDEYDIKRLGRDLEWLPGKCAYCKGSGMVEPDMIAKVAVDEAHLTNDLSGTERRQLIERDPATLERLALRRSNLAGLLQQIRDLHFDKQLNEEQIADLFFEISPEPGSRMDKKRKEMIEYIKKVIAHT